MDLGNQMKEMKSQIIIFRIEPTQTSGFPSELAWSNPTQNMFEIFEFSLSCN